MLEQTAELMLSELHYPATLETWLEEIKIGEPVRSWLRPRLEIKRMGSAAILRVKCKTFDSDKDTPEVTVVQFEESVPPYFRTFDDFSHYIREIMERILTHELHEGLTVRGRKVFDPHKNGRRGI